MRTACIVIFLCFLHSQCMESSVRVESQGDTFPHGLFSLRSVVHISDFSDLMTAFDSELQTRKHFELSKPPSESLEECLTFISLCDWVASQSDLLSSAAEFGSRHMIGSWKDEFLKRRDELSSRVLMTPQEGQRLYAEIQIFKRLYAERVASIERRALSDTGTSNPADNASSYEESRTAADMREFHLLATRVEMRLAMKSAGPEAFQLAAKAQSASTEMLRLSNTPGRSSEIVPLMLKMVAARNGLSRQQNYPNCISEQMQRSAVGAFEASKGRSTLVAYDLETSPMARFLRTTYKKVLVEGLQSSLRINGEELVHGHSQLFVAPDRYSLLEVLTAFSIVTKGLLNVGVEVDFDEDFWNESSFVLKVIRPSEMASGGGAFMVDGDANVAAESSSVDGRASSVDGTASSGIVGRMFVQLTTSSDLDPSSVIPCRPRTRSLPNEPGIALVNLHRVDPSTRADVETPSRPLDACNFSSKSINSFASCRVGELFFSSLFHELTHALHFLLSNLRLGSSHALNGSIDYAELPSQLFEHFGRDWVDFLSGKTPEDTPSPVPSRSLELFKVNLFSSMASQALWLGQGYGDIASLFNDPSLSFADVSSSPMSQLVAALLKDNSAYMIDRCFALMVYSRGDYRIKVWKLFQQYQTRRSEMQRGGSPLDLSNSMRFDAHRLVDALAGEQGMRSFFASGVVNQNFGSFLAIVPGLEKVLDEVEYLEDAVDFDPQIRELTLYRPELRQHSGMRA